MAARPVDHVDIGDLVAFAPDQRGLVSKAAAVLALNSLRIHSALANVHEGVAITEFVVSPVFGSPPESGLLRQQFNGALAGDLDVLGTVERRDSDAVSAATARAGEIQSGVPVTRSTAPPRILWLDTATPGRRATRPCWSFAKRNCFPWNDKFTSSAM